MYNENTLWKDVYDDVKKMGACVDPDVFFGPIMKANPNITYKEMVEAMLESDESKTGWSIWAFLNIRKKSTDNIRELILRKVKSPSRAFSLYIEIDDLTKKEEEILTNIFKGKLKSSEKKLNKGLLKRKVIDV
jgi:hypothetical protein